MADLLKNVACKYIDDKKDDLNHISQEIWKNPELNFEEYAAHELLTSYLEKEGFDVLKKTPLETSFIARYGDSNGLKIGICCEYDALPGVGHACGHNLIAEAGIGAALGKNSENFFLAEHYCLERKIVFFRKILLILTFNRNTYRFYRKFSLLYEARTTFAYEILLYIDKMFYIRMTSS